MIAQFIVTTSFQFDIPGPHVASMRKIPKRRTMRAKVRIVISLHAGV